MARKFAKASTVLTIRVTPDLDRRLAREAHRRRRTRSETARTMLQMALEHGAVEDPAADARRQSLLASRRTSEHEALEFIAATADLKGWR